MKHQWTVASLVSVLAFLAIAKALPADLSVAESNQQKQAVVNALGMDMDRARFDKDLLADKKNQYTLIQKLLVNILQPKPIVDTISEKEKYGNEGESFGKIGRGIVGGVESLTYLLSSAVDLPFEAIKSASRKATATLSNIGTKLVGL